MASIKRTIQRALARRRQKERETPTAEQSDMKDQTRKDPDSCEHFNRMEESRGTSGRSFAITVQCTDCGLVLARHTRLQGAPGVRYFNAFGEAQEEPKHEIPSALEVAMKKSDAGKPKKYDPFRAPEPVTMKFFDEKPIQWESYQKLMGSGQSMAKGSERGGDSSAFHKAMQKETEALQRALRDQGFFQHHGKQVPKGSSIDPGVREALEGLHRMARDAEREGLWDVSSVAWREFNRIKDEYALEATFEKSFETMREKLILRHRHEWHRYEDREQEGRSVQERLDEARERLADATQFLMMQAEMQSQRLLEIGFEQESDYREATRKLTEADACRRRGQSVMEYEHLIAALRILERWMKAWNESKKEREAQDAERQRDDRFKAAFLAQWNLLPEHEREVSEQKAAELLIAA